MTTHNKRKLAVVGYVILAVGSALAVYVLNNNAIQRERVAQLAACERLQVQRDTTNGTNFLIHDYFKQASQSQRSQVATDPANAKEHREASKRLAATADRQIVTPPTNCIQAVDHPERYRPPNPVLIDRGGPGVDEARTRAAKLTGAI